MKPDPRNVPPAPRSMLWWYVWTVVVAATAVTVLALPDLSSADIGLLLHSGPFWLVAVPMVVTAVRPIVPTGRGADGTFALVVFLFALLLRYGLAPAVLIVGATLLARGLVFRQAVHRNLFNAAQHILTVAAAWGVLHGFGIEASPKHPWTFHESHIRYVELGAVALAGVAYLLVNNGSVYVAIAMAEDRSLLRVIREDLRHLSVVAVSMVSIAPLVLIVMVHVWPLVPLFYPALVSLYHNARLSMAREHDALHDPLTGLANRELLHREAWKALEEVVRQDSRADGGVALFVLDLDKFKQANDTLGHAAGDRLLMIVADRLRTSVRADDLVARLGGDEFVVMVRDVPDLAAARLAAVRLQTRVAGVCDVDGVAVSLGASVGVAVAPEHGVDFDLLLRCADHAMYVAKAAGCGVAVFDPEVRTAAMPRAAGL